MEGPPRPFWLDHQAFCRRHGLDYDEDLVPQFTEAFEHYGRDYEQIRGSVSFKFPSCFLDYVT